MKWHNIFFFVFLHFVVPVRSQEHFRMMFYNVENLFDCRDDSLKDDAEFLPESERCWTRSRYWKKMNALSKVVAAVSDERIPDIIGVCEVENDSVLYDWTRRSAMRTLGYRYVVTQSPDSRGVDVGLLYQPGQFRLLQHREVPVPMPSSARATRNILYVKGLISSGDTLHVMVCHLPSRLGKRRESENRRGCAAKVLRDVADSVFTATPDAKMVVMGDFNANVGDRIFGTDLLDASSVSHDGQQRATRFYLLRSSSRLLREVTGTYRYRGFWEVIDHFLLSPSLMKAKRGISLMGTPQIVAFPFMYEQDTTYGGVRPFRTYNGPMYKGGFSDHFPIVADFEWSE